LTIEVPIRQLADFHEVPIRQSADFCEVPIRQSADFHEDGLGWCKVGPAAEKMAHDDFPI
jgi:hypothetical protein